MTIGPDLLALGREHMENAHKLILVGGALGIISILAAVMSRRIGAPGTVGVPCTRHAGR